MHHVVDEHEWIFPYRAGAKKSGQHGPLTEESDKDLLEAGSPANVAVCDIVCDKRLLKKIPYYLNCKYISNLSFTQFNTLFRIAFNRRIKTSFEMKMSFFLKRFCFLNSHLFDVKKSLLLTIG